jgi:hypothetical protein
VQETYTARGFSFVLRSKGEVERFFAESGLEVVEPGVVPVHRWRPDGAAPAEIGDVTDADINVYAGVGRKG